ncbi:Trp biosynthesis-associated membrane protein [Blastococcus xanthinilyticus]|uniref:Putative membrane protein (TIGR02234 family) n=1 Tax=Blastococcus xanthinilyticus TaxID=1564164 RepID=A0A5S5CPI8_9ACTN|nr:Trp biosynthesis-associated membrane protein [Blastococcus xanthinilyticus]TYP84914.1 putative membrane protein (TIGR02234 family) [Blastococcus xanthinilyticus]
MSATSRRELATAVAGGVVAGALALSAAGQQWAGVTVERRAPFPPVAGALSGTDAAPLVPAAGLVLLAAALALLAVRGAGRIAVGVAMAAAGVALLWAGVRVLAGGVADAAADLPGFSGGDVTSTAVDVTVGWPALAVVAGVLAAAVGVLVAVRGRSWPGMGQRYERSSAPARERSAEDRADDAWKALDRGEDPTDPAPGAPVDRRA